MQRYAHAMSQPVGTFETLEAFVKKTQFSQKMETPDCTRRMPLRERCYFEKAGECLSMMTSYR